MTLTITTPRITLRVATLDDIDAIQAAKEAMWPILQKWMAWSSNDQASRDATQAYVLSAIDKAKNNDFYLHGFCKDTGKFIMATGINATDEGPSIFTTGYWVAKGFQGQGYATEGTLACIYCTFSLFKAKKMTINYYADNMASKRVIEKLGFTYLRTNKGAHTSFLDGTIMDVHQYEMTDPSVLPPLDVTWQYTPDETAHSP